MKKNQLLLIFALLPILFFSTTLWAARIVQFKGNRVIIELEKAKVVVGQKLQLVDAKGKVAATAQVMSIKGTRALGKVLAGKPTGKEKIVITNEPVTTAAPNLSAPPVQSPPAKNAKAVAKAPEVAAAPKPPEPKIPYRVSTLLGLSSNTLALTVSNGIVQQNVDNTGNSFSVGVAADRTINPWLTARAMVLYEQFNAIGAATINGCANQTSKDCETDLQYLSFGAYAKHEKVYPQFVVSASVGINGKYLASKKSTALVEADLGSTVSYGIALGADYVLESKAFIPFIVEKQFFLKSASAEMSTLNVRTGFGREF